MRLLFEKGVSVHLPRLLSAVLALKFSLIMTTTTVCAQASAHDKPESVNAFRNPAPVEITGEKITCSLIPLAERQLATAYQDTCRMLLTENSCSEFFGRPGIAIEALSALVKNLRPKPLEDRHVGVRMSGRYDVIINQKAGGTYRLFETSVLNLNGPFFNEKSFPSQPRVPNIGLFRPNTREARVTILLHELGHMMRGAADVWLLPNDAGNAGISADNTDLIIKYCGPQINHLTR